ncbi:FHA domain-containing serine/threonine-protein kinase [Pseudorhodoferax sp.]|uniref:FHA domain-containing serine/threonine-protein kinase n=1 Tax=Pseudorhodoferax sp. TaxID=1993553 RepID=UPI002DD67BD4|nr:FHA domain-containing serine/threonine-protein kinase [Pseudorhodoferax sp.]
MLCPFCFEDKPDTGPCPSCGQAEEDPRARDARYLPYRHVLRQGRYRIGAPLGKPGGFGVVYRALDTQRHALVVVKECLLLQSGQVVRLPGQAALQVEPEFERDHRKWLARFRWEARLIQQFKSPHIVRVTDKFEENNTAYYVMPFVEGEDLNAHCTARGGRLPGDEVARIARQLLAALQEVHGKNFVHRDIKPSNVIITRNKRKPVLIDFGAARDHFESTQSRSHMGMFTPAYAPIEQAYMAPNQGPWTDLYSLGATLYFCLTGAPPPNAVLRSKARPDDPLAPLRSVRPDIDPALATAVEAGLALMPGERVRDAVAMAAMLPPEPPPAPPAPPPPPPGPPTQTQPAGAARQRHWLALLPALAVLGYGLAGPRDFGNYITGAGGLALLASLAFWAWWHQRLRRRTVVNAPPTVNPTLPPEPPGPSARPRRGVEITLQNEGAAPFVHVLRPNERLTIGRTGKSNVVLANPLLSGRHAAVSVEPDGRFTVQDLGSLNHTYVRQPAAGGGTSWHLIESANGWQGSFMLGPPQGRGVRLDIRQVETE